MTTPNKTPWTELNCITTERSNWEHSLKVGDIVLARWGYGSGFRAEGLSRIIKINRQSYAVTLLQSIDLLGNGGGWPKGHTLRGLCRCANNLAAWERWTYWKAIHPAPCHNMTDDTTGDN